MGPYTRLAYEAMQNFDMKFAVEKAAHIHIKKDMWDRIYEIVRTLPDSTEMEGRLPSESTVVEVEGQGSFMAVQDGDRINVLLLAADLEVEARNLVLGAYWKRSTECVFATALGPEPPDSATYLDLNRDQQMAMTIMFKLDLLFSFMAEPRLVYQKEVSRPRRAMSAKKLGVPALRHTWVKVGWTIGKPTTAKSDVPGSCPQKAFHMVRGHWRNYGDRQTKNAERRPHRAGWWVWVEAYYSGNPALGEIKHHYTPKLEDPGASSRTIHAIVAAKTASATPLCS